jgi:hypothetical protein
VASRGVKVNREEYGVSVAVYGYKDTMKALRSISPDVAKEFTAEIKAAILPVQTLARAKVPARPMRNWDDQGPGVWSTRLGYNATKIRRGITTRQGGRGRRGTGTSVAWRVVNKDAAGAVFEIAGRRTSGSTRSAVAFRSNLTLTGGRPSRLIWQAWDELGGDQHITPKVVEIADRASATAQALLNAANDKG